MSQCPVSHQMFLARHLRDSSDSSAASRQLCSVTIAAMSHSAASVRDSPMCAAESLSHKMECAAVTAQVLVLMSQTSRRDVIMVIMVGHFVMGSHVAQCHSHPNVKSKLSSTLPCDFFHHSAHFLSRSRSSHCFLLHSSFPPV